MPRIAALALLLWASASAEADELADRKAAIEHLASPRARFAAAQAAADAAEREGRPGIAARILSEALIAAASLNDLPALTALGEREVALCRTAHDLVCEGNALLNSAYGDIEAGRSELALSRLEHAITLFRQTGQYRNIVAARYDAAGVREELGDIAGALRELRATESLSRDTPARSAAFDVNLAELLLLSGKPADALAALQRISIAAATSLDAKFAVSVDILARAEALTGLALARLGRTTESDAAFRAAVARSATPLDVFENEIDHARALLETRRAGEALPIIRRLQPLADHSGATLARHFHELAARVYAALGHAEAALAQRDTAAALQTQLYRESLAEAVASSNNAIALAEREAAAEHMARQTEAARSALARTRIAAAAALVCLIAAGLAAWLVAQARARRARDAALAAERARISADIHDTLLQGLIGMSMQLRAAVQQPATDAAPVLARVAAQASATLIEARRAVGSIRARPTPPAEGLARVVETWLADLRTRVGVALLLTADPALPRLPPERIEELDGVLREAVANALKHSEPSRIEVALRMRESKLEAVVRDDGCGFNDEGTSPPDRWGLRLMRERMARAGGKLQVRSTPGAGTVVTAIVPC